MFVAHLPAGYLMARSFAKKRPHRNWLILTGLFASILPDLDLFWFYLINGRRVAHHAYVFHIPLFWILVGASAFLIARLTHWRSAEPFIWMALLAVLLHMVLDSVAAEIAWFKPFSAYEVNLFHVPAIYDWWVWNFVLHWTFVIEIGIVAIAGMTLWSDLNGRADQGRKPEISADDSSAHH